MSLDGGLEEVEEFLRSFAISVSNWTIYYCSSAIIVKSSCSYTMFLLSLFI